MLTEPRGRSAGAPLLRQLVLVCLKILLVNGTEWSIALSGLVRSPSATHLSRNGARSYCSDTGSPGILQPLPPEQ
jgi:hypothetical protein